MTISIQPADTLLDVQNSAARLGLSMSTLNKLRCHGNGPKYAKLGKSIRYRIADLDAWITANLRASTSEASRAA